jgi:hypothetical protein
MEICTLLLPAVIFNEPVRALLVFAEQVTLTEEPLFDTVHQLGAPTTLHVLIFVYTFTEDDPPEAVKVRLVGVAVNVVSAAF